MVYIIENAVPILMATLAGLAAGLLWWRLTGLAPHAPALATAAVAEAWLCAILAGALILAPPRASPWVMAIMTAVVIWIGFVLPALVATHAYRGLSAREAGVDGARWLIVMVVQAAVLTAVGLTRPPAA